MLKKIISKSISQHGTRAVMLQALAIKDKTGNLTYTFEEDEEIVLNGIGRTKRTKKSDFEVTTDEVYKEIEDNVRKKITKEFKKAKKEGDNSFMAANEHIAFEQFINSL